MKNAVTIDLEDYYQVTAFSQQAAVGQWNTFESRIERNTAKLLSILEERGARATFFTLGWTAEKYPNLVKEIAGHHHEIACHSNVHRSVCDLSPEEFRQDTLQAKRLLEDVTGRPVYGYRAPSFSIKSNSLWAFEILAELGFTYDSSIFPIDHPSYGWPRAPRFPFAIKTACGPIVEFPMPTLQLGHKRAPIGGGAYLRLLPYWFTRWGLRHINDGEEQPVCVYLHPWELDSEQPRMEGSVSARLRHYFGLRGAEAKFRRILRDFEVQPLNSTLEGIISDRSRPLAEQKPIPEVSFGQLGAFLEEPN
ncbi:MAG TPA: XrtA system polysaccharide deacetylase [Candidatus Acidoferrum sp.]|jgi:polysaccharide deacetylase family protein (PEP-CTERM system associated)